MSGPITICIDSDDDSDVTQPPPPLTKREGKKRACSAAVSIDLTDDADLPPPLPSGKARKQLPSHNIVVDLCDDDGLLETDSAEQDFARQFQQSFDEVEIVGEKWATSPPPASHGTAAWSDCGVAATSDTGSSSTAAGDAEIDTSNDEDFAARLQAEVDREIRRERERRDQRAGEDEEFARTLQARLNRDIEEGKKRASEDILYEQRVRIREWIKKQAAHLSVRDVYANPAAMPDGELYRRFKEAQEKAVDKSVRLVFHGTREDNIECICREGLDPRRRGANGQAHGPGEYFAENPSISVPYCAGGKKMIVFAVLMDKSGLTKRDGSGIVVVNKTEHQLPMFVITDRKSVV